MALKTVLITGTSAGGIGSALASAFARRNYKVFATARDITKVSHLASLPGIEIITLDVTLPDSIMAAVEAVKAKTDGKGLDILINNAGAGYLMPLVDADLDYGRRMFEVNFWGMLATTQAFTPLLVNAKGTVVNVSSVGGIIYTPWIGLYSASKAAFTIASETLRLELAPLDVKLVTVMTGYIDTKFFDNAPEFHLPPNSLYKPVESNIADAGPGKNKVKKMDVDVFAERVVKDILRGTSGPIWRGSMSSVCKFVASYVPTFLLDNLLSGGRGLDLLKNWVQANP